MHEFNIRCCCCIFVEFLILGAYFYPFRKPHRKTIQFDATHSSVTSCNFIDTSLFCYLFSFAEPEFLVERIRLEIIYQSNETCEERWGWTSIQESKKDNPPRNTKKQFCRCVILAICFSCKFQNRKMRTRRTMHSWNIYYIHTWQYSIHLEH